MLLRIPMTIFLLLSLQQAPGPRVHFVTIHTELSTGVIAAYTTRLLPAGEPISDKEKERLRSELLSTGLFTDVKVTLEAIEDKERVNVHITPTWRPNASQFRIGEIAFEGFDNLDVQEVLASLKRKGIEHDMLLMNCSLLKVKNSLFDAVAEIYKDKETRDVLDSQINLSQFKIAPINRNSFKLIISASE